MGFHFFYGETAAIVIEGFASGGHFLQTGEQEAGQSFETFVVGKLYVVFAFRGRGC